jgi:hypothetical protein
MTKEEFNKLEVLNQLEYINNSLVEGKSLRIISSSLSMSKTTFRDRFTKIGYIYDANTSQYTKNDNPDPHLTKESLKSTNKFIDNGNADTPIETHKPTEETVKSQDKNTDDDAVDINKELINTLLEQLKVKDFQMNALDERLREEQELNKNNQILQLRQPQEMKQLEEHFALIDEKLMNIKKQIDIKKPRKGLLKRLFNK